MSDVRSVRHWWIAWSIWAGLLAVGFGQGNGDLESVIEKVLEHSSSVDVPFREVIEAVTGKQVLQVDPDEEVDREILEAITTAIRGAISELNLASSPARKESRINEVSRHFETSLQKRLDELSGFSCETPKTREGKTQASGYPDLRIVHLSSGRVVYLDPKLLNRGSVNSSLRTFYYTPRTTTSKVVEDAHHLLVGIEHDGNVGQWQFTGWKLVDLYDFKVRLKAEYQASNKDLYQEGLILESE
tara:strand:- start:2415 stop:3146 length:732 start_codon:yes stop_codon:yes gene_type:complete